MFDFSNFLIGSFDFDIFKDRAAFNEELKSARQTL